MGEGAGAPAATSTDATPRGSLLARWWSSDRRRVSFLDRRAAGQRVWLVARPVTGLTAENVARAVRKFAATSGGRQLAHVPDGRHSRWNPRATLLDIETLPTNGTVDDAVAAATNTAQGSPLRVLLADDTVGIGIDHGFGDATFMLDLLAAISHAGNEGHRIGDPGGQRTSVPMVRALPTVLSSPGRAVAAARALPLRGRRLSAARPASATPVAIESVFVRSRRAFVNELNEFRLSRQGRPSLGAVVMVALSRALRAEGLPIDDDVRVVVDLRRYLPSGLWTTSNFISMLDVDCGPAATSATVGKSIGRQLSAGAPLISTAVSRFGALVARARRRGSRRPGPTGDQDHLTVTFSDLSRMPLQQRVHWTDPAEPDLAVVLPPASSRHVAVGLALLGERMQLTATFDGNSVSRQAVSAALHAVVGGEHLR